MSAGILTNVTISKSSLLVGKPTEFNFSVKLMNPLEPNSILKFVFPTGILFNSSASIGCKINTVTQACNKTFSTTTLGNSLSTLSVNLPCTSGCVIGETINGSISGLINGFSSEPLSGSILIETIDNEYVVDSVNYSTYYESLSVNDLSVALIAKSTYEVD
jgi:hypothetical protein